MSCKKCDPLGTRHKPGEIVVLNRQNYGKEYRFGTMVSNITCEHCGQKYHIHQQIPIN